jgi:propionate CoA-transferase
MEFAPLIHEPLAIMDSSIFHEEAMGLLEKAFTLNMSKRLHYDAEKTTLYLDLRHVHVYDKADISKIESAVAEAVGHAGVGKVDAVITYDDFDVSPFLVEDYAAMTKRVAATYYKSVRRYNSRSFARHKLNKFVPLILDVLPPVST